MRCLTDCARIFPARSRNSGLGNLVNFDKLPHVGTARYNPCMNVVLIGARGSGKTTIGRLLAPRLALEWIDLDERVLASFPLPSVRDVWERRGEAAWREAETHALRAALGADQQVIACGGGVPMIPTAAALLQDARGAPGVRPGAIRCLVVHLHCSAAALEARLRAAPGDRPPLHPDATSPADEIRRVLMERTATYERLADMTINVEDMTAAEAAEAIASRLPQLPAAARMLNPKHVRRPGA
jgi:shikimate kinase